MNEKPGASVQHGLLLRLPYSLLTNSLIAPKTDLIMHKGYLTGLIAVALLAAFATLAGAPLTLPNRDIDKRVEADQLVREVVANEIKDQRQDHSLWQYEETREQGGTTQFLEVVETRQGDLHWLVAVNGHPLATSQMLKEDARIQHLISSPQALQNQRGKEQKEVASERHLLGMLPNAFQYQEAGNDGALIRLDFKPDPAFHASDREAQVFHHMEGSIWVEPVQKRLARMVGQLTSEVKFGGGILGHLAKGGTFEVEQQEVGNGHWELTQLDVNMNGKALFFKTINVKQKSQNSNFKPVPPNTTLLEAAQMLKRESAAFAENFKKH